MTKVIFFRVFRLYFGDFVSSFFCDFSFIGFAIDVSLVFITSPFVVIINVLVHMFLPADDSSHYFGQLAFFAVVFSTDQGASVQRSNDFFECLNNSLNAVKLTLN